MNFSKAMLQAAKRATPYLGEAAARVADFARGCAAPGGGFRGRDGNADLYYTVFGIDCLLATGEALPEASLRAYLASFRDGAGLDLPHLSCLARCWSRLPGGAPDALRRGGTQHLLRFRAGDGGYHLAPGRTGGSVYGCFLALSAFADLGVAPPDPAGMRRRLKALAAPDGAYAGERGAPPTTNATVGAILLALAGGDTPAPGATAWLLARRAPEGGFTAGPSAPAPDLVSTATAVFALRAAGADLSGVRAACEAYVSGLWDEQGGFCGHWLDDIVDCEHTFHGLLTLGCLQEEP